MVPKPCVRAPLPYESITFLAFMCLPLPIGLFNSCGVDESLGLHSLHLILSLGWTLLGCGLPLV